ncbi:competence protein [Pseudooceanicola batsensis HTCC2597]|uniref:Competence protein n=1 Tax=Pseudooceanicola batsensis (strain ATCC BAA-863 / DSM 15984 / KCTC 12145 / HTCC2597) TaxID=252305 RepID=A3U2X2_PSEBH|nr:ComEC/Rec2 family competence protein [Pseudooceanicola batsensis]EAQ01502.1 competence protein [Pseudooceanicola batsensis HTCC2597]
MPQGLQIGPVAAGRALAGELLRQRGFLFPWVPVALGIGIGGYFALPVEPGGGAELVLGGLAATAGAAALRGGALSGPVLWLLAMIAAGGALAAWRAQFVAAPVLEWRYYGPVTGRIVGMDRSASDALRLTLDRVHLADVAPSRTPARVRISLHGDQGATTPVAGLTVMTTAHLSPPAGPVEPGGFDFQRHAWFARLGAVGYTRVPVVALRPPDPGATRVFRARMALSDRVRGVLAGDTGAFAAAVMAGDRSGLSREVTETLRRTNLAHLLAISGLHMGLVAGFVYAALRLAGAAVPYTALRWPVRSVAALVAVAAGAGYLMLSGGSIATERAFVMAAVALVALVFDRRAITFRALAMAALVVLVLRPEALLSPGFQMSFAATTALVAVFGGLRGRARLRSRLLRGVMAVVVSSSVAGLATAPVGAAHFNTMAHYGLAANLLAVPLMGMLVMPAGVVAVVLMPLGLEALALTVMGWGLDVILFIARTVASWPGAVGHVPAPGEWVLPLFAAGGLSLALWQGPLRWLGLVPLLVAGGLWTQVDRPGILIDDRGALVGVLGENGRALSRAKGAGFVAQVWLENDGSGREQAAAAALWPAQGRVRHLTGKRRAEAATCAQGEILVLNHDPPGDPGCEVFSPRRLHGLGAVAITRDATGLHIRSARAVAGRRLWNDAEIRAARLWRAQ